jgi:hypothetical protein
VREKEEKKEKGRKLGIKKVLRFKVKKKEIGVKKKAFVI